MNLLDVSDIPSEVPNEVDISVQDVPREQISQSKQYQEDSELLDYMDRGTVTPVHGSDSSSYLLAKIEQDRDEVQKAILLSEINISPNVHFYDDPSSEFLSGEYYMDFLRDYAPVEDIDFNGMPDFNNYVESVGRLMGSLDQIEMVHGDLVRDRIDHSGLPQLRNIMFDGDSYDAKVIDPETARFHDPGSQTSDRLSRAEGNSVIKEQEAPNPETESEYVFRALVTEAIESLDGFAKGIDYEELKHTESARKGGQELPSTDFTSYIEKESDASLHFNEGKPVIEGKTDSTELVSGISRITNSYREGYSEGKNSVDKNRREAQRFIQEVESALN